MKLFPQDAQYNRIFTLCNFSKDAPCKMFKIAQCEIFKIALYKMFKFALCKFV